MTQSKFRWGWLVAVLAMAALACTCGALGQAQQAVQTAEALATEAQQLATQAEALATDFEAGGFAETAEAVATQSEGGGDLVFDAVPEDVPVYPQNDTLFSMEGAVTYFASASFQEVVDFYKQEMPNNGWSESSGSVEASGSAVLYYQKDGRNASVTLSDLGAQTAVQILIEGN